MEAVQEKTPEQPKETPGLTAKQMAAAEEANQARLLKLAQQQEEAAVPKEPAPMITDVVSQGYDALHEQFRRHNEMNKPKEYVPPPRTERQMTALEEELAAGARAVARAEAAKRAQVPKADLNKEGFTTPVYRPGSAVPDPVRGGLKEFGPDA